MAVNISKLQRELWPLFALTKEREAASKNDTYVVSVAVDGITTERNSFKWEK